ncbi:MAG: sulfite oxidase, partial [Saprospiraceae bacterium]|nr:sulfite oxidase [Bacteroidia bacterium]NNL91782.1 sulfite oxidase [Saprospiraceae bacterium]
MKKRERRYFIKQSLLASFSFVVGMNIVHGRNIPIGMRPIILDENEFNGLPGKSNLLTILNDKPINAETPAHLLNDDLTPNELFFVRNNGNPPINIDKDNWFLTIEGESAKSSKTYDINTLKNKFEVVTYNLTLECGGNGRSEFNPPAKGNQWTVGAVGCAAWTGVRLKDVLADVGIKNDAVYIGYYGADTHLSGDASKESISRGVPIAKAMEDESLIAWSMNGKDLPLLNGYPLRLVFGGYPASCSGKWLEKIVIRNKVHDGQKMDGQSYRIPCETVAPGSKVEDEDMCIIENMPVKSLITYPQSGATIKLSQKLPISGHAWTSAKEIVSVEYSIDFGMHWQKCLLNKATNRYAWQRFNAEINFQKSGYYEVWA